VEVRLEEECQFAAEPVPEASYEASCLAMSDEDSRRRSEEPTLAEVGAMEGTSKDSRVPSTQRGLHHHASP
jgi:hypothetical protein